MLPWYLGSLVLGGVLIGASIVLGAGDDLDVDGDADLDLDGDLDLDVDADVDLDLDVDADVDLDADVDADVDADHDFDKDVAVDGAGTWLPFLSLRFWTFALMSFGLMGTLSHLLLDLPVPVEAGSAGVTGVAIGWGAAYAFRKLKQSNVSGRTQLGGIRGSEAIVLLPLGPGKTGKVRALVDGHHVDLLARTRDGLLLARKERVLIVSVEAGVAEVTSMKRLSERSPAAGSTASPPDPESST